jgi:hypothetical protein
MSDRSDRRLPLTKRRDNEAQGQFYRDTVVLIFKADIDIRTGRVSPMRS